MVCTSSRCWCEDLTQVIVQLDSAAVTGQNVWLFPRAISQIEVRHLRDTYLKVIHGSRSILYQALKIAFDYMGTRPLAAELGVLRGENAQELYTVLAPSDLYLIDAWNVSTQFEYVSQSSRRNWMNDISVYADYYGGSLLDQQTHDTLHAATVARFSGRTNVHIIRETTAAGLIALRQVVNSQRLFDYIYIDANHTYESVLDDMLMYSAILSAGGVLQLNDCCHSADGVRQNLGVLEAVIKFTKMSDFEVIAMTNTDWSDVLLVRKGSQVGVVFDAVMDVVDVAYVDVPTSLLGAARVRTGARANLSFC